MKLKDKRANILKDVMKYDLQKMYNVYKPKLSVNKNPKIHHLARLVYSDYLLYTKSVNGIVTCVTCGAKKKWYDPNAHPGHFREAGTSLKRKFVDDNVRPQCYYCNVARHGNYKPYTIYMQKRFGQERVDMILADNETCNIKNYEYADMIIGRWGKIKHMRE